MTPPVYDQAIASPAVIALLGSNPTRLWPFGEVPRDENGIPAGGTPYTAWQIVYGNPENTLSCPPGIDMWGIQVDTYARTPAEARDVTDALRDAYEAEHNYVVAWNGEFIDEPTRLYRSSFTVEFWTPR